MSDKIARTQNQQTNLLQTLILFLQSLGYQISSYKQLFNGIVLCQFLSTVQGINIHKSQISLYGQHRAFNNFSLLQCRIQQKMNKNWTQANITEIKQNYSMDQLLKLMKSLFIISTRSQNNNYFIEKILTLPVQSQLILADLIKKDKYFRLSPSPSREYDNQGVLNDKEKDEVVKEDLHFKHKFSIIDKMYELQVQNQRLLGQIKKINGQNGELREHVGNLCTRIQQLRRQCQQLRKQLTYTTQSLSNMGTPQLPPPQQAQNSQLLQILTTYRDKFEQLSIQTQQSTHKLQEQINYYKKQVQRQHSHKKSLKQQLQFCHKQFQTLIISIQDKDKEIQELQIQLYEKDIEIKILREKQLALKFQIGYRDSRIQELKGIVGLGDNSDVDSVCSYNENDTSMRKSILRSSKMLASQFPQNNTNSTPNLHRSLHIPQSLRNQLKYLRNELQKTSVYKSKIKQLQLQKNRLMKILAEYEDNRGEENQILMGCLYQMHSHYLCSKANSGKGNASRSTLADEGVFQKEKNWIQ